MRYTQNKLIALTFDDGPSDTTTDQVLDVLARHDVVGTFFLIGDNITDERLPVIRRTLSLGCEIENHSKTHSDMRTLTREQIISEIEYTTARITEERKLYISLYQLLGFFPAIAYCCKMSLLP